MTKVVDSRFAAEEEFWAEKLKDNMEINKFPGDFKPGEPQKYMRAVYSLNFPVDAGKRLVSMSNGSDYALYMILLTGVSFLLVKYMEKGDTTVIMPVFRQTGKADSLINSILPLKIDTSCIKSFRELLLETKKVITQANSNQNYPVINKLKLQHGEAGIPVINTAVLLGNIHEKSYLQGFITNILFDFTRESEAIELRIEYNSLIYKYETIEKMTQHLLRYFDIVMKQPDIYLDSISVMSEEERAEVHARLLNLTEQDNAANTGFSKGYIEDKLLSILKKQMGNSEIGLDDDFFYDLGGNSLIAINFWSEVTKELNFELPLSKIFGNPTIRSMAESISSIKGGSQQIDPVTEEEYYPVSAAQERMYITYQAQNGGKDYNIPVVLTIDGAVDITRMSQTFSKLIQRHESLRTSFGFEEGRPVQVVHKNVKFELEYSEAPQSSIMDIIDKFRKPFDLSKAPLFRAQLVKISENKHVMLIDTHHIVSDGTSMSIITRDFINLYEGEELPELRIQYKDFSKWQNGYLQSSAISKQEEYWVNTFTGELPVLNIPSDYPRPAIQTFEGDEIAFKIEKALTEEIKTIASETGTTLYMFLLAAYTTLLYKYTEQQDIVVGSPVAGRLHPDLENVVGMFVNTLAMRNYPQPDKTFREFLREVRNNTLGALENQEYQFEMLVKKLDIRRDMSRNPLFDTMFILQNIMHSKLEINKLKITPYKFKTGNSKFDIVLVAEEKEDGIEFCVEYCTRLYSRERMQKLSGHFINILKKMARNPDLKLAEIDMLSGTEKQQLLIDFNDTLTDYRKEKTIHQLFEEQVEKIPDNTALVFQDRMMTYSELNRQANKLAHILIQKGVRTDALVGIAVKRSIEMIVAILGVLKAGGAYLPIDIEYPEDRIRYMLEDSKSEILLTDTATRDIINFGGEQICIDDSKTYDICGISDLSNPAKLYDAASLAYVIYTSGSTGKPKGVMLEHRGVNNFITGMTEKIDFSGDKSILAVTTISFDIFVLETLLPLTQGLKVVIADENQQKEPELLCSLIQRQKIDILQATPSRIGMLLEYSGLEAFSGVKQILIGGEAFPKQLLNELIKLKDTRIYNMYGPTETTVWSAVKEMTEADSITIGKPIANTRIYILNKNNSLQPVLTAGELCIAGDGLARGYLNRTDLTKEKFVPDPFKPDEKMYRTGDLAMWLPDGEIEFLGRIDHQVKIRGYRIEIGEIEAQLLKFVKEAVVIDRQDSNGNKYLCSYIVQHNKLELSQLRQYLSKELPAYMIPSYFIQLEKLPLTPNGKLDRKALPEPDSTIIGVTEYTAPSSMLERIIANAWQNALQIGRIGVYDNYFELGGDSVKAIKIVSELDKSGIKLTIGEIFSNPVLKNLAEHINNSSKISQTSLEEKFQNAEVSIETAKKDSKAINSSKELKIVVQEDIRVYLSHALPLCAILADESVRPWYYEHYINIFSMVDEDGYFTADFLEYAIPYKDIAYSVQFGYGFFINERSNIVAFTVEQLENNYYMIVHFDEYYITDKTNYMRNHFVRHSLIYGYDNDKKLFSAVGFNASGMFDKIYISYDDFRKGFESGSIHYKESAVWCKENAVEMIKHGRTRGQYPFDIGKFKGELNNYIESKEDFTKVFCIWSERKHIDRNKLSYGISVYDSLTKHISDMSPEKITIDYRAFHLLYEQKNSIYLRIKYIAEYHVSDRELDELAQRYRAEIVDGFNKLRVRMLNLEYSFKLSKDSFNASESWKAAEEMCSAMLSIKEEELDIIRKILRLLTD